MMTDIMMMEAMMTAPIMNNAENMRKTSKQGDVRRHIPFLTGKQDILCEPFLEKIEYQPGFTLNQRRNKYMFIIRQKNVEKWNKMQNKGEK